MIERPASAAKELIEKIVLMQVPPKLKLLSETEEIGINGNRQWHWDGPRRPKTSNRTPCNIKASNNDLQAITTLGFRGEALPSIAAVSRFFYHLGQGMENLLG